MEPTQIIAFEKYAVDLDRFEPKAAQVGDLKPRERYLGELLHPEATSSDFQEQPNRFVSEVHERFSNPFYPVAFVLIALAVVGQAQSTREGRAQRIAVGFGVAVGIRLAGLAANNLVVINASAVPLLYAIPLGTMAIAMVVFVRAGQGRRGGPGRFAWLERLVEALPPLTLHLRRALNRRIASSVGS
jgi:lipopolysaccharide export system permease protein